MSKFSPKFKAKLLKSPNVKNASDPPLLQRSRASSSIPIPDFSRLNSSGVRSSDRSSLKQLNINLPNLSNNLPSTTTGGVGGGISSHPDSTHAELCTSPNKNSITKYYNSTDLDITPPPSDSDESDSELKHDVPVSMMKAKTTPNFPSQSSEILDEVPQLSTLHEQSQSASHAINDSYPINPEKRGLAVVILASTAALDDPIIEADINRLKQVLLELKFEVRIYQLSTLRELRESPSLSRLSSERGFPSLTFSEITTSIKNETKSSNYCSLLVFTIGDLAPIHANKNLSYKLSLSSDSSEASLFGHRLTNKLQDVLDLKPKIFIYNFLAYEPTSIISNSLLLQDTFFCYFSQKSFIKSFSEIPSHSLLHYLNEELNNSPEELSFNEIFLQARIKTYKLLLQRNLVNTIDFIFFVNSTLTKSIFLDHTNLSNRLQAQRFNGQFYSTVRKSYKISSNTTDHGLFIAITTRDINNAEATPYWSYSMQCLNKLKAYFKSKHFSLYHDTVILNRSQYYKSIERLKQKIGDNYDCLVIFFLSCDASSHRIDLADKTHLFVQSIANEFSAISPGKPKIIIFSQVQLVSKKNTSKVSKSAPSPQIPIFSKFDTSSLEDIFVAQIVSNRRTNTTSTFIGNLSAVLLSRHRREELHKILQVTKDQYDISSQSNQDLLYYQELDALKCKYMLYNEDAMLSNMIRLRGKEFKEAYQVACLEGTEMFRFFRLMIVGPEGIGKTSLLKCLTGKPYEEDEVSTSFIEKFDLSVQTISNDWTETQDLESYAQNIDDVRQNMAINFITHSHNDLIDQLRSQAHTNMKESNNSKKKTNNNNDGDDNFSLLSSQESNEIAITALDVNFKQSLSMENFASLPVDQNFDNSALSEQLQKETESLSGTNTNQSHMDFPLEKLHDKLIGEYKTINHPDFFTAWDFAGQAYLYCFHSLFLSPRAIYLLLVDLSVDDLNEPIKIRSERLDRSDLRSQAGVPASYLEAIEFWMNAIYFVSKNSTSSSYQLSAKILLVFSKADSVDNPVEKAQAHFDVIKEHMNKRSNSFSLVCQTQELFVISCLPSSVYSYNTQSLKDEISKVSDTVAFNQEIPIKWLEFARCLLQVDQSIIDMRHIERMAELCECRGNLSDLLHLFHDIGFFFLHDSLIIKDIQSFLNLLFHIISPQSSACILPAAGNTTDRALMQSDIELCINEARLSRNLLDAIFSHLNLTFIKADLISMLLKYGVLIEDDSSNIALSYYVPYLLKGSLPELSNEIQAAASHFTCYLYFPDGFIPASLYFTLLSWLLQKSKNRQQSVKPKLGFDIACFHFSPWMKVVVDFSTCKTYIRLVFIQTYSSSHQSMPRDYLNSEIFELLISIQIEIIKIQAQLIPCGNASKIVFECPCRQLYQLSHMEQPCVFFDQLLSLDAKNRHSWCHIKQSYVDWNQCFNDEDYALQNLITYNDSTLMARFIMQNIDIFAAHFNFKDLMSLLYKFGLTTSDKIHTYLTGRVEEELNSFTLLGELMHKGRHWAFRLYLALSRDFSSPGHQYLRHYIDHYLNLGYFSLSNRERPNLPLSTHYIDRYRMNCNPHGIALLVNIEKFSHDSGLQREGSNFDLLSLRDSFEQLQYLVHLYHDLTRLEFKRALISISRRDHTQYDSFVCIVMSHGDENENIMFHDGLLVSKTEIYQAFSPLYCQSLKGKPKIFIFQACRGDQIESELSNYSVLSSTCAHNSSNNNINYSSSSSNIILFDHQTPVQPYYHSSYSEQEQSTPIATPINCTLPPQTLSEGGSADKSQNVHSNLAKMNHLFHRSISIDDENEISSEMSDVFIGNSSLQNYVSYRDVRRGSLFIQCFCKVIKYSRYEEFLHIMNEVRRKVSRNNNSHIQCTEDINHLRRKLYFF